MTKSYYPIFLDVQDKQCVIAGGGDVSVRKAKTLVSFGAKVKVVAPTVSERLQALADEGVITCEARPFAPADLDGAMLVIGATDNEMVNRTIFDEANKRSIPVNIVDQPELCTFIVPSVVRKGDLAIAISTGGKSPAVAKRVRKKLQEEFGDEWGVYLDMMGRARRTVTQNITGQERREEIFNKLADSDLFDLVAAGDIEAAQRLIDKITDGAGSD